MWAKPGLHERRCSVDVRGQKKNLILNHCYAIPSGAQLTVQFVAFNPSIEGQPLQKLVSNVAHLRGIR